MIIAVMKIRLHASWVHSLKEKRMVVKSLTAKIRNQFHVSAAEVEQQDVHQTIVIGVASIAANRAQADSIMEEILRLWMGTLRLRLQKWRGKSDDSF